MASMVYEQYDALLKENEALRHDIARHVEIASKEAAARIAAEDKLDRVSKLLDDWEEAEKRDTGLPIFAGIRQLREALK